MIQAVIQKWGNSQALRLPRAVLNAANMQENDAVSIEVQEDLITLRKLPRRKTLDGLFARYSGDYRPVEFDYGAEVGPEVFD